MLGDVGDDGVGDGGIGDVGDDGVCWRCCVFHLHALILFLLYPHISHPQGTSLTPEVPAHQHNLLLSRAVLLFQTEAVPALRDVGVMIQCLGHVAHLHRFGILRSQVRHLSHHLALLTE